MKNLNARDESDAAGEEAPRKEVGAVVHAVTILRYLAKANVPDGVTMIARATGISPSTTFNILRTLTHLQLLNFDAESKTYRLGIGLAEIFAGLIGMSPTELVQPELDRVSAWTSALTVLWRRVGDEMVVVGRGAINSTVRIETEMGTRIPVYAGAIGRCVAAAKRLNATELKHSYGQLTWENPPTWKEYQAQVRLAAEEGWAMDDSQTYQGVTAVASAIVDANGEPQFGMSAIMLTSRHKPDVLRKIGEDVRRSCERIAGVLYPTSQPSNQG